MSIFRVKKDRNYTVMSNCHLKEKDMSLKAIGLLSKMLSLPDDWDYSLSGLVAICKENETAIKSALDELKTFGYLEMVKKLPNETKTGRIEYEYIIYEKPNQEGKKQALENLPLENLPVENPAQLNTKEQNTKNKSNNINIITNISNNTKESKKKQKELEEQLLNDNLKKLLEDFSDDISIRNLLQDYLDVRKLKGITIPQWQIILEDLRKECSTDRQYMIDCIRKAIAGGWSQIVYINNFTGKAKSSFGSKPNFDNTQNHKVTKGVAEMSVEELSDYYENQLAKDENGNFLKF